MTVRELTDWDCSSLIEVMRSDAPENRFAVAIDAVVPHNSTVANILFGATLDAPATHASWGVSDLQLFLR